MQLISGKRLTGRRKKDFCSRDMESMRIKMDDITDRTKWKRVIQIYSSNSG